MPRSKTPMTTRSRTRRNASKRQVYRSRVKSSNCRGQTRCRTRNGCKTTKAKVRRSYCRKSKNARA